MTGADRAGTLEADQPQPAKVEHHRPYRAFVRKQLSGGRWRASMVDGHVRAVLSCSACGQTLRVTFSLSPSIATRAARSAGGWASSSPPAVWQRRTPTQLGPNAPAGAMSGPSAHSHPSGVGARPSSLSSPRAAMTVQTHSPASQATHPLTSCRLLSRHAADLPLASLVRW